MQISHVLYATKYLNKNWLQKSLSSNTRLDQWDRLPTWGFCLPRMGKVFHRGYYVDGVYVRSPRLPTTTTDVADMGWLPSPHRERKCAENYNK